MAYKEAYVAPPPSNTPLSPLLNNCQSAAIIYLLLFSAPSKLPRLHRHPCLHGDIRFGQFLKVVVQKNVYRDTEPIFKSQLTRTKLFSLPYKKYYFSILTICGAFAFFF